MISTRGRYALRMMLDLAQHRDEGYVPMKSVAARQGVSLKYMEQIAPVLTKNHLVEGIHGKGGGYRLTRPPEDYSIGEILRLTEKDMAPVACLYDDAPPCSRAGACRTRTMWTRFYDMANEYFDSVSLADLLQEPALP